jgi:hypothetical protein
MLCLLVTYGSRFSYFYNCCHKVSRKNCYKIYPTHAYCTIRWLKKATPALCAESDQAQVFGPSLTLHIGQVLWVAVFSQRMAQ